MNIKLVWGYQIVPWGDLTTLIVNDNASLFLYELNVGTKSFDVTKIELNKSWGLFFFFWFFFFFF